MPIFFTQNETKEAMSNHIRDNANELVAVIAPLKGELWSDFEAKIIARAPLTAGDFFYNYTGPDLRVTTNAKTNVDPIKVADDTQDLCIAAIDSVNEIVLIVQDAQDRNITNEDGDLVVIPGLDFDIPELVAAA